MAMTICQECKNRLSDQALMCPHCGRGQERALETLLQRFSASSHRPDPFEEKRRYRRIEIRTMVTVDGEHALLFNISRGGMMLSAPFHPKRPVVDIDLEAGECRLALKGVVRWVSARRSFSNLVDFGVEITAGPPGYQEFLERIEAG